MMSKGLIVSMCAGAMLVCGLASARAEDSGVIKGKVTFKGGREGLPADMQRKPIATTATDPNCHKKIGTNTAHVQKSADGSGFEYVLVSVKSDFGGKKFDVPSTVVKLTQEGCEYKPFVLGVVAGQKVEVHNDDDTSHNVHGLPKKNEEFNKSQPKKGAVDTYTFNTPEPPFFVKCDVHPWMGAYVGVFSHPYFAVTSEKGEYEIKGLPAGEYEVEFWHPNLGTMTQKVKVEGGTTEANVEFEKK